MKNSILRSGCGIVGLLLTTPVTAQVPVDNIPENICGELTQQWADLERSLSILNAQDSVDNSAPRAQMRSARRNEEFQKASFISSQMREEGCPDRPIGAPNGERISFLKAANKCVDAQLVAGLLASVGDSRGGSDLITGSCETSAWKPDHEEQ